MPLVRSSLLLATSAMLSESPPSNERPRPILPTAARVGAVAPAPSVPFIGPADESVTASPDVSSKPSASTRPAGRRRRRTGRYDDGHRAAGRDVSRSPGSG